MRGIAAFCVCFMLAGLVFAGDKEHKQQIKELEISVWVVEFLKEVHSSLPRNIRKVFFRADSGFFSGNLFDLLEPL